MRLFGLAALGVTLGGAALVLVMGSRPTLSQNPVAAEPVWAAAAPGRVEPKGRELRVLAPTPALIKEVVVGLNDRVKAGDLLIRLDDEELKARLEAAKPQVALSLSNRDDVKVSGGALDRRKAEDALYNAERDAFDARMELDRLIVEARQGKATDDDVKKARATVADAVDKVQTSREKLKKVLARDLPAPKREDVALAAARADVAVASASLERMRIRAPADAAVLEVNAKAGEMAVGGETPLLILGDPDRLQVRAEVDERDIGKIHLGQSAVVKSDAFPGRSFDVRVSQVAKALFAPRLASQNRRKPTEFEVLEVLLDVDDGSPLLPGMRVDVLFREVAADQKSSSASQ